jgi:hypothetical protein
MDFLYLQWGLESKPCREIFNNYSPKAESPKGDHWLSVNKNWEEFNSQLFTINTELEVNNCFSIIS